MCFSSCQKNNKEVDLVYCQVESSIEEYPDSSFFSDITCMTYCDGKIYVQDRTRGDIVALSDDFTKMEYVCRHGEAPYEVIYPAAFGVQNDTVYVVDFGTKSMKKYYHGVFVGSWGLLNANENRFSLNDSLAYLSATTDSTSFLTINMNHPDKQIPMGKVIRGKSPFKTYITNKKHILYDKQKGIFSVADCFPYIDRYNARGEYVKTFDISYIPVIKKAAEAAEELSNSDNSVYSYINDAYLADGYIYLLCASNTSQKGFCNNTILKLSIDDEMKHVSTYILPHDIYSSFCVSGAYLFASQKAVIEKIKIGNEK